MKKTLLMIVIIAGFLVGALLAVGHGQPVPRYGYGPGMTGGYTHGYGWFKVPPKLPAPKSGEWVQKLRDVLAMEKSALAQFQADQETFNAFMPYMMAISQTEQHVLWLGQLLLAYGLASDGKASPAMAHATVQAAYEAGVKLNVDLLPRYEWLVKHAEDRQSAGILNSILLRSRMQLVMFEHAARVGYGYGYGMMRGYAGGGRHGYGMGPGMMDGYGYGMGPGMMDEYGYGWRRHGSGEGPVDAKEAATMMNDYLKATQNPNLKLGKIRDAGSDLEAEVLTRDNSLADKILIDKNTGWMRSAYR